MRILIAAGGTAGHINPALAIAQQLKTKYPTAEIHFAGRRGGMEYALVTKAGYPFHHIEVRGIQRSLTPRNIIRNMEAVYYLALSGHCANAILKTVSPQLVIGTGGYVSGPIVRAAAKRGIKTAIHEQNAYPGVTNKLLAKDVDIVLAAMPDAVEKLKVPQKTVVVGNPVRPEVFTADRQKAREAIGAKEKQIVILSFGGSLGAQRINEMIAPLAAWHINERNFLHIHATGSIEKADFAAMAQKLGIDKSSKFVIREYIDNMPMLLAAADLVICRAGALTLAEISAAGKASVLIPSPNVAENHQYHNAMQLAKIGAATVIEEKNLTPQLLIDTVDKLTQDFALLMEMGAKARNLAMPNSLVKICDELELLL